MSSPAKAPPALAAPAGSAGPAAAREPRPETAGTTRSAGSRWLDRRGLPTLVVILGGVCLWAAFSPHNLWPLAVLGPAALSLAVHGRGVRGGAWLGFVLGLAYLLPLLNWSGVYVGIWPWLLLAGYQAGFLAVLGAGLALAQRVPGWPVWSAALWVADEALRSRWAFGGFPWGRLGFSQADSPFTAYAAYGGVPLLSFALALSGTLLAAALCALLPRIGRPGGRRGGGLGGRRAAAALAAGAVAVPLLGLGLHAVLGLADPTGSGAGAVTVAVVQGDVPQPGLEFNARRRAVLDNHVQQTLALAARVDAGQLARPSMVIWPENASDIDPYLNADAAAQIDLAAKAVGVPILVGAVVQGPGDNLRNMAIVWDPVSGPGQTYVKRHPVPFGEYIPWRPLVEAVAPIAKSVRQDFVGGDRPGVLDLAGTPVGDVICFEVAYDGLVDDVVDGGAQLLVVQTNNATFGYTSESYQQLAMSRIRAVEQGRTVLVASTSGVSAIIAPDGTVRQQSELFTPALLVQQVALRSDRTLAARLGAGPEWLLTALGLAAVAAGLAVSGRRDR